jgi:hypothetical protein
MIVKIMNENGNKSKKQFDNYFFMAIMRKKILTLEKIMKKKIQRETYTTKKRTERLNKHKTKLNEPVAYTNKLKIKNVKRTQKNNLQNKTHQIEVFYEQLRSNFFYKELRSIKILR